MLIDSIFVNIVYELLRVVVPLAAGKKENTIDIVLYLISVVIIFILIPCISRRSGLWHDDIKTGVKRRKGKCSAAVRDDYA